MQRVQIPSTSTNHLLANLPCYILIAGTWIIVIVMLSLQFPHFKPLDKNATEHTPIYFDILHYDNNITIDLQNNLLHFDTLIDYDFYAHHNYGLNNAENGKSIAYIINGKGDVKNVKYHTNTYVRKYWQKTQYSQWATGQQWHEIWWKYDCYLFETWCDVSKRGTIVHFSYDLSLNYLCYQDRDKTNNFELKLPWIQDWAVSEGQEDSGPTNVYDINIRLFCNKSIFASTTFSSNYGGQINPNFKTDESECFLLSIPEDHWSGDCCDDLPLSSDYDSKHLTIYGESNRDDIFTGSHSIYSGVCDDLKDGASLLGYNTQSVVIYALLLCTACRLFSL